MRRAFLSPARPPISACPYPPPSPLSAAARPRKKPPARRPQSSRGQARSRRANFARRLWGEKSTACGGRRPPPHCFFDNKRFWPQKKALLRRPRAYAPVLRLCPAGEAAASFRPYRRGKPLCRSGQRGGPFPFCRHQYSTNCRLCTFLAASAQKRQDMHFTPRGRRAAGRCTGRDATTPCGGTPWGTRRTSSFYPK